MFIEPLGVYYPEHKDELLPLDPDAVCCLPLDCIPAGAIAAVSLRWLQPHSLLSSYSNT